MVVRNIHMNISSSLTDVEWSRIEAFKYRAQRLSETSLFSRRETSSSIRGRVTLSNTGFSFSSNLPPEEAIVEHLLAFRFFLLKKERSNFDGVLNLLREHVSDDEEKEAVRWLESRWRDALFQGAVTISWNGKELAAGKLFDLWLNGLYFHGDEAKSTELRNLWATVTEPFAKYALLDAMYNSTKTILRLSSGMSGLTRPQSITD